MTECLLLWTIISLIESFQFEQKQNKKMHPSPNCIGHVVKNQLERAD